jgi:hypothetical protein
MPLRPARELSTGWLVAACACAAGLAVVGVAYAASPVPRITPDSASYLTGAERLASDWTFAACTGPITLFAPGYSAALAPLVAIGLDAPDAARLVNALATLALVLGAGALARATGLSRLVSVLVAVGVAVSYATLRNGALVWSEPLFCAILAWLLVLVVNRGRGLEVRPSARLAGVLLLAWALLLTRHSGVFLLPAVVLAAWLGTSRSTNRTLRVGVLGIALVSVPAAWWLRNVHVDGEPFGRRSGSRFDALEVLDQLPDGLSSLALPNAAPLLLRLVVLAPLLAAAVLAWRRSTAPHVAVAVLSAAAVVYAAAVTLAAMRTLVDPIDTRLLSPILVPAAVLIAIGISTPRSRFERTLGASALLIVAAMTVLAPGVAWRGHDKARVAAPFADDSSCADWPASYSGARIRLPSDRG